MLPCKLVIKDEVNIRLDGLPADVRRQIANKLKFELPYARHLPQYKLGRWDGTTSFFGIGGTGYLNHLDVIMGVLAKNNFEISEIEDLRTPYSFNFPEVTESYWADKGVVWPAGHPKAGQPIMLRSDQCGAINDYLKNPQSLQCLSTGFGKTILTATLSSACEPYGRTMVIVPNKSLVVQTEEDYKNVGLDVGVYFGDRKELGHKHTIITWQSLSSIEKRERLDEDNLQLAEFLEDIVCVMVDEAHGAKGNVLQNLLSRNINHAPIRWGMTGTIPKEEVNFNQLLSVIGPVVGEVAAADLQEKGILSTCHIHIKQLVDTQVHKSYADEYKFLTTHAPRLEYIARMCNDIRQTGNTLILVDRIATGEALLELIPGSSFVSGKLKMNDRKDLYNGVNVGENEVLVATYQTSAVGINIPRIFNLVLVEPGKSFIKVIQSIGRGIRKAEDKDHVEVYDVCSTCKYSKRHLAERKRFYKEAKYKHSLEKIYWQ